MLKQFFQEEEERKRIRMLTYKRDPGQEGRRRARETMQHLWRRLHDEMYDWRANRERSLFKDAMVVEET